VTPCSTSQAAGWRSPSGGTTRPAALLLVISVALFVVGVPVGFVAPQIGALITTLSIGSYATVYPLLADLADRLDREGQVQTQRLGDIDPVDLPIAGAARVTGLHR
jgi:hypothetical protein